MLEFAQSHHLEIVAYSPLGHGHLLKNPTIITITKKHQANPAQICLARCLSQ